MPNAEWGGARASDAAHEPPTDPGRTDAGRTEQRPEYEALARTLADLLAGDFGVGRAGARAVVGVAGESGSGKSVTAASLARECTRLPDGSISVKVGVEVNVLLGPAGAPGRFDVPVTVQIRHNGTVITSRVERAGVAVGSGEAQGFATIVVDALAVPVKPGMLT